MPTIPLRIAQRYWTYGVEHELADWDTRKGFGVFGRDPEPNILNSNGIAGDPTLRDYPFGAELNSPPTSTPDAQADLFQDFVMQHPFIFVSHRIGMHVHIRVPGLAKHLPTLKQIQKYVGQNQAVYRLVDPVPDAKREDYETEEEYKGGRRWTQYIRRSHWTCIPANRVEKQMKVKTVEEFFPLEAPMSKKGKVMYHAQPRAATNLRQLLQSDTIEFRFFFQAEKACQVLTAVEWCRDFLQAALDGYDAVKLFRESYSKRDFPPIPPYIHWLQKRWEATSHSLQKRDVICENMQKIMAGEFDDVSNDQFDFSHLVV